MRYTAPTSDNAIPFVEDNFLHLQSLHALDVSPEMVQQTAKAVSPSETYKRGYWHGYIRWEPLDVKLWQGGLESFNPEFVGVDCIVSTEVYVFMLGILHTVQLINATASNTSPRISSMNSRQYYSEYTTLVYFS